VAKLFRLNFERYHLDRRQRPSGAGAFFDFVSDAARLYTPMPKSPLGRYGHKPAQEPAKPAAAAERPDEGANTRPDPEPEPGTA
jgi:hypothetical protein